MRMAFVELPHLAVCAPAEISVTSVAQICLRDGLEAARRVEVARTLVGERFVVDEGAFASRLDRGFVEALGIQLPAFDTSTLRADQCGAALEILRATLRPGVELSVMGGQRLDMGGPFVIRCRIAARCVRERAVKVILGFFRERSYGSHQTLSLPGRLSGRRPLSGERARLEFSKPIATLGKLQVRVFGQSLFQLTFVTPVIVEVAESAG